VFKAQRYAIIGCGGQAERRIRAAAGYGFLSIVGVYDRDAQKAEEFAAKFLTRAISEDEALNADIIVICTPPDSHFYYASKALTNHRHVLCEKPLTISGREAANLFDMARKNNCVLRAGYHLRHYRGVSELKRIIDSGKLGDIQWASFEYGSIRPPKFAETWRANAEITGGGVLADQGVHIVDLAMYLLGYITLEHAEINSSQLIAPSMDIDDDVVIFASCKGANVKLSSSWLDYKARFQVNICGTQGQTLLRGLERHYGDQELVHNGVCVGLNRSDVWGYEWWDMCCEIEGKPHVGSDGVVTSQFVEQVYTRFA
jgi:1,5-anhydro-D-fructose reductase (1,5-anhydro-D-mannitol-forming)